MVAPRAFPAVSASPRRISLTRSSVIPGCFHAPCDSPRSPNDRQTTCASPPAAVVSAIYPPARQTKSAACALTTSSRARAEWPATLIPYSSRTVQAETAVRLLSAARRPAGGCS